MAQNPIQWHSLFGSRPVSPSVRRQFLTLKKHGEPLLVLPHLKAAAAPALSLYPAQSLPGRLCKWFWQQTLARGLIVGAERSALEFDPAAPFAAYLKSVTGSHDVPQFAILAGNPQAPGRRFLVLLFDPDGKPAAVVKAGVGNTAAGLIQTEFSFLATVGGRFPAVPKVRHPFQQGDLRAFAMDFVAGDSPRVREAHRIEPILESWLDTKHVIPLTDLSAWQRLSQAAAGDQVFARVADRLQGLTVHPTLLHGDLAPWNVKVSRADGSWTALDWERGQQQGPPGWDWFHYVLQPAILVQKLSPHALVRTAEAMLASAFFRRYSHNARLAGREREWLLAYLFHCRDVLRPAEGSPKIPALLNLLWSRWRSL